MEVVKSFVASVGFSLSQQDQIISQLCLTKVILSVFMFFCIDFLMLLISFSGNLCVIPDLAQKSHPLQESFLGMNGPQYSLCSVNSVSIQFRVSLIFIFG